ncbi:MAG: type IV toxin-antitoxin system AbiEi family antitoxin domain-containing protein [Defluviitaleaceae bacterium]|nr:type IV toxin-antitoxin system AbiEi family antitoxin domain-containing protein [Defluviitaleaceae bacterium]
MTDAKIILLNNLLVANNGIVKTETLAKNGFSSRDIKRLNEDGLLKRIKQGYYIEKQSEVCDTVIAARLIPMGVLCLYTAVDFYGLATVNPSEICVALPRGATCPVIPPNLYVKVYHMAKSHFEAGISEAEINGATVRMYNAEKTVCDCFKYENEVERNVALEVLKNYIARSSCNIQKLLEYAKLIGKKKIIYPYVEALI